MIVYSVLVSAIVIRLYSNLEEMQKEFVISAMSKDGKHINMEIKQKHELLTNRKVKKWTTQEDNQLLSIYNQFPKRWAEITAQMPDRNENQCLHRHRRLIQLGHNHKIWSTQQDETILKMLKKYGKNWKLISEMLGTKNGKQIRERFINKLDPKIKKQDWISQQDLQILQLYSKIGSKWSQISKYLPGRPQNKIKNRFYSYISKNYDIRFKQVENMDLQTQIKGQKIEDGQHKNVCFDGLMNNSQNNLDLKMQRKQSQVNMISKFEIPSINEIYFDLKMDRQASNNNLFESVFKAGDDWRINSHCNSVLELRSQDFLNNKGNNE